MAKQKIEVNENINVSIGELLKANISGNAPPPKANEGIGHTEEDAAKKAPHSSVKGAKPNINARDSDIKKIIPKLGKISLQHQRSGRGGKTVTLVYVSGEAKQNLEPLLKDLKKSLGCGGQIEEGKIVLQGEIADRVSEWFTKMGAK